MSDMNKFISGHFAGCTDTELPEFPQINTIQSLTGELLADMHADIARLPLGEGIEPNFKLHQVEFSDPSADPAMAMLKSLRDTLCESPWLIAARNAESKNTLKKAGSGARAIATLAKEIAQQIPFISYLQPPNVKDFLITRQIFVEMHTNGRA